MSNSPLVDHVHYSPNTYGKRDHVIDGIAIHCVVGQCTVESLGNWFANPNLEASSNYGIGYDGRVGLYVDEIMHPWTTSSYKVDSRCVTIEVASDTTGELAVTDAAFAKLLDLVEDICRRNNIKRLGWSWDEATRKAWAYGTDNGCNMQVHRDWAYKSCPGEFLYSRHEIIKDEINRRLNADPKPTPTPQDIKAGDIVKIREGATYTNGRPIPGVIIAEQWIVKSVNGSKALLDKSVDGNWSINSTVYVKWLDIVGKEDDIFKPYVVRVTTNALNIRSGPGTNYAVNGCIRDKGAYTIVQESAGQGASMWGKLKSGAGWISLDWVKKI